MCGVCGAIVCIELIVLLYKKSHGFYQYAAHVGSCLDFAVSSTVLPYAHNMYIP